MNVSREFVYAKENNRERCQIFWSIFSESLLPTNQFLRGIARPTSLSSCD